MQSKRVLEGTDISVWTGEQPQSNATPTSATYAARVPTNSPADLKFNSVGSAVPVRGSTRTKRVDQLLPIRAGNTDEISMALIKRGTYWHFEFMIDGQRCRGSTKETVKSRAQTIEALKIAEVRNGSPNFNLRRAPVPRDFSTRFLAFVDAQLKSGHLDRDTKLYYYGGWKMLSGTKLARMRIDQIGTSDAAVLRFPHSTANANRAFRTLSRMLHLAAEWKLPRAAPRIKLLEEQGRTALIEPPTEALLLEHAPQPLGDILVVIMDSGMRPEEVVRMQKEHVLWDRSVVVVPYGKTLKSKRYVPLSDRMREVLRNRQSGDTPWVFPSRRAACGHLTTINGQSRKTVAAANTARRERNRPPISTDLTLCCARHMFATDMLGEGLNLAEVGALLGHTDVKTTMKYLHPDITRSARIVNHGNLARTLHRPANESSPSPQNSHSASVMLAGDAVSCRRDGADERT